LVEADYFIRAHVAGQPPAEEFLYPLVDQPQLAAMTQATQRTLVAR
jgi:hypothetical protein